MKSKYLIIGVFVLILLIAVGIYFYIQNSSLPKGETLYGYKADNPDLEPRSFDIITSTSFLNLNEESAKMLAEKAIKDDKYFVSNSSKEIRNGKEVWIVQFESRIGCQYPTLCAGGYVLIDGYNLSVKGINS